MTDPWWDWDTEDDDNWMAEFSGGDIRALVRERNRLLPAAMSIESDGHDRHVLGNGVVIFGTREQAERCRDALVESWDPEGLVLVRSGTGGVFPDGTTNHIWGLTVAAPTQDEVAERARRDPAYRQMLMEDARLASQQEDAAAVDLPQPIYCTGGCDTCREAARRLGVPLIVASWHHD